MNSNQAHAATRSRLGGVALLVRGPLYGLFWVGPVFDMDLSIVEPHWLQLVFYG